MKSKEAIERHIKELLSEMTVEEKLDELDPNIMGIDWEKIEEPMRRECLEKLEKRRADARVYNALQKYAKEQTRLGIPFLFHEEALHGLHRRDATIFPQQLTLAGAFEPALCEDMGRMVAAETRAKNIHEVLAPVLALGLSPFIMQSTESLVNIAFNSSLKTYGGDPAVGAMTICSSIMQVFSLLFQGLSQGAQPIVGYNYGAGQLDRVKRTFRLLFFSSLCFSCAACAALELFPGLFVSLFNDKPELVEIAVWALHIYAAGMFMLGVQFSCQQTFVALGQTRVSLFLALLRKVILLIPLILLLPRFLSDQVFAVFLAEPVADILAATTTGAIFFWRLPRILEKRRLELEHRPI